MCEIPPNNNQIAKQLLFVELFAKIWLGLTVLHISKDHIMAGSG